MTAIFRKLLEEETTIYVPDAYDALSAMIIEKAGFKAIGTTGYGMSASLLGKPDSGLLTMDEILRQCRNIISAVNVPVMCDIDTGFGNPINVIRTVKEFERAGAANIWIEDQASPKKCGRMAGKEIVSIEEMVAKIKAAVDARDDPDFLITVRTDAEVISLEEAIKRGKAYASAGADIIKPSLSKLEQLRIYSKELKKSTDVPLHTHTFGLPHKELEELGNVKVVSWALPLLFAATKGMMDLTESMMRTGDDIEFADRMITFHEFAEFIGWPEMYKLEKKYLGNIRGSEKKTGPRR